MTPGKRKSFRIKPIRIATKDKRFLESKDFGKHWIELQAINAISGVLDMPREDTSLGRLVLDLHTGRAFLGKQWGWIWIDLAASLLILITLSGLIMQYGIKSKKSPTFRQQRKLPPEPSKEEGGLVQQC